METEPKLRDDKSEPFSGAYFLGLVITIAVGLALVTFGSIAPPLIGGLVVAFLLGLTVTPQYARWFLVAGLFSAVMGFMAGETLVAWGGVGIVISSLVVWLRVKS